VLLLGSAAVQASCDSVSDAVYAVNERAARLISGAGEDRGPETGLTLSESLESFRAAVRSELDVITRRSRLRR
jgi:hypothetical protein